MIQPPSGILLVLSGPSGAGKTTLARRLVDRAGGHNGSLIRSISVTTRPPRRGEQDGSDYAFVSDEQFSAMAANGDLLEHTANFGHQYGTPRPFVEQALSNGKHVLLVLDVLGFRQLAARYRGHVVGVFVLPPSLDVLANRLRSRRDDNEGDIYKRLAAAHSEIAASEEYDYTLVNRDFGPTLEQLNAILQIESSWRIRPPSRSLSALRTARTT